MIKKDIIETEVKAKGFSQVQQDIMKTSANIDELQDTLKSLTNAREKEIAANGKQSKAAKNLNDEIKKTKGLIKDETAARKQLYSQLKLDEMSYTQLKKRASELTKELNNWTEVDGRVKLDKTRAELQKVQAQIDKTKKGLFSAGQDMQKTPGMWGKAMGNLKNILPTATLAGVGGLVLSKLKDEIVDVWNLAQKSQAEYVKNNQVLGDSFGYTSVQAEKFASKMGLTKNEFVSATAKSADLFLSLDFGRDKAAKMGTEVTKLGGILSEWTKGQYSAEDASKIVSDAMLGQTDGLRNLGVVINKSSADFKSRQDALMKEQNLTAEQAQALTVLEMAYKKSSDAQKAFSGGGTAWQKSKNEMRSWWQGLKEDVADYFALTAQQRLDKQVAEMHAMNQAFAEQNAEVETLMATYTSLTDKSSLTAQEQTTLNETIERIQQIAPGAISRFDEYGNALEANIERLQLSSKVQQALNDSMNQQTEAKTIKTLKTQLRELEYYTKPLEGMTERIEKLNKMYQEGRIGEWAFNIQMKEAQNNIIGYKQQADELIRDVTNNIVVLRELGNTYEDIARKMDLPIEQIKALDAAFIKSNMMNAGMAAANDYINKVLAENAKQESAAKAAAEKARAAAQAQAKARETAIRASLDLEQQEILKYRDKLKQAGITEEEITTIKNKEVAKRSALETEKLTAYEALYREHKTNIEKIDEKERAYRQGVIDGEDAFGKENTDFAKRLKDAGLEEAQIVALKQKSADELTEIEKQKLLTWSILHKQHQTNIARIETEGIQKWRTQQDAAYNQRMTRLKTLHNNELASITDLNSAKAILQAKYGMEDVSGIQTIADAKKIIRQKQQAEEEQETLVFYTNLQAKLQELLNGENFEGINLADQILSEEQKEQLIASLEEVGLKISEMRANAAGASDSGSGGEGEAGGFAYKSMGGNVDVFGMSPDDWATFMTNLEQGKFGIDEMIASAGMLVSAFQMYDSFMSAGENRRMREFEKNTNKRKAQLKAELDSGAISQNLYNQKLETLDKELEDRKAELELKQARRQKASAIMAASVNTAVAITQALGTQPAWVGIALAATIGALGLAQVALIAAQPLPGKEEGGFLEVERTQDGKRYHAEYTPQKRGYVNKPSVIVGENGTEYVIPAEALSNPGIASFVDTIEAARLRGNLRDVDLSQNVSYKIAGRQIGGYAQDEDIPDADVPENEPLNLGQLSTYIKRNNDVMTKLEATLSKGIQSTIAMYGSDGLGKKLTEYNKQIEKNRL